MNASLQTAAGNPENQDRGAIIHSPMGLVLAVADGAGGRSGGTEAATLAIEVVRRSACDLRDPDSCVRVLREMDQAIARDRVAGETTCALAVITDGWTAQIHLVRPDSGGLPPFGSRNGCETAHRIGAV